MPTLEAPEAKLAYSVREVIEATGLGRTAMYEQIRSGRLPARRLGTKIVVMREDLIAFMDSLDRVEPREAR